GLPNASRQRIDDVGVRINACCQRPDDVIHAVDIDVRALGNRQTHALVASENRGEKISLPTFFDLVALLYLDDAAAPIGHGIRDVQVLNNSRLKPLAQFVNRGLAQRGVDVIAVEYVYAEQIDERPCLAFAHCDRGNVEGRRLISFAHVTGPFGMEKVFALRIGTFSFGSFVTLVARIEQALEHIFGFGYRIRIYRAGFDNIHSAALNRARDANFITTLRQDHIIETATRDQRAGRRH